MFKMRYVATTLIFLGLTACQNGALMLPGGSSLNGSTAVNDRTTLIQATASDSPGVSITKVEFYVNGALTCTVTSAPYNCPWSVPAGAGVLYSLQTKAYDTQGKVGTSSVVQVTSQ